jgi:hypothetical protein
VEHGGEAIAASDCSFVWRLLPYIVEAPWMAVDHIRQVCRQEVEEAAHEHLAGAVGYPVVILRNSAAAINANAKLGDLVMASTLCPCSSWFSIASRRVIRAARLAA